MTPHYRKWERPLGSNPHDWSRYLTMDLLVTPDEAMMDIVAALMDGMTVYEKYTIGTRPTLHLINEDETVLMEWSGLGK